MSTAEGAVSLAVLLAETHVEEYLLYATERAARAGLGCGCPSCVASAKSWYGMLTGPEQAGRLVSGRNKSDKE